MGKHKQAQRTKNNTRPSNSSRSAELLGSSISNFVGFSAVRDGGYIPVLPGLTLCNVNEVEMSNLDSNFQIVLKKMNKKDSTTKCKALQEFAIMCRESELSLVEGMLSFWPRLYCALAIDSEHRVREAAQLAHAAVVKRVGKSIAVYLKQVAGAWFTSQYDTYPPAASAAINSFNETFPERKIIDAIIHCQREILAYICDNITVQTPQTLSQQKSLTAEEMEAKYQKVVVSNLRAYSSFLKKVPKYELKKMAELHKNIISNNKFWKLVRQESLLIKTAFFNVLSSIIEHADVLLQDEKKRSVTTIMNSLDETDPGLLSAVWESMLVAITKIEDWFCLISIEKLVLPKLWRVLRNGGQCCASTVYPNLLPFISQFPKLNMDINYLYTNFFNNMRQGFTVKSVQVSRAEMSAVGTSFIECLRYSILLNVNNEALCSSLLKNQLFPLLETCLKENSIMKHVLFCEITQLVRYWSKNRNNEEYKAYSILMSEFWTELNTLYASLINESENCEVFNIPNPANNQIDFLLYLKTAPKHSRKNLKVKFTEAEEKNDTEFSPKTADRLDKDIIFLTELNEFINTLCVTYFKKITEQRSKKYIVHLNKLVTSFEDSELFAVLLKSLRTEINFFNVYNDILREWLLEKTDDTEHIIKFIFNIIKYMNDSEKEEILELLTQIDDILIYRNVIECSLSKTNRNDNVLKKWYSKRKITELLIDVVNEIVAGKYEGLEKNETLILLAFETFENGDLLIQDNEINRIISILFDSLNQIDESYLSHFAKLMSKIVPLTWAQTQLRSTALQVSEMLFDLCISDCFIENVTLMDSIQDTWKECLLTAIENLPPEELIVLIKKLSRIIWNKIYNTQDESIKEATVNVATDFIKIVLDKELDLEDNYREQIVRTFLIEPKVNMYMVEATGIVLYGEIISGKLYVSSLEQNIKVPQLVDSSEIDWKTVSIKLIDPTVLDSIEKCLTWALFNTSLLNNICIKSNADENSEPVKYREIPGVIDLLMNIVYSICLGEIYKNYYKSTPCYCNAKKSLSMIRNTFSQLWNHLYNDNAYIDIVDCIISRSSIYGSMLPYVIDFCCFELKLQSECETTDLLEIYKKHADNKEMQLQGIQILSNHAKSTDEFTVDDDEVSKLIVARYKLDESEDASLEILNQVIQKHYGAVTKEEDSEYLLLNCDISNIAWNKVMLPLELIRLLTELINKTPAKLTEDHWNSIMILIVLWQATINKSKQNATDFKVAALTIAICQLYNAIENLMRSYEQDEIKDISDTVHGSWRNVLAAEVQCGIVQTWICYAELYNTKETSIKPIIILDYLGNAISHLDKSPLFKDRTNIQPTVTFNLDDVIDLSFKLLQSPILSIQLAAYHILRQIVPELVQSNKIALESENFDPNCLNVRRIEPLLQNTENIVNTILMDFKLCDTVSCTIQPYTDSYTYTVAYLLTWAIILDMCANANGDLRYQYAEILKDKYFPSLLNNIFRLMPVELLPDNKVKNKKKGMALSEIFTTVPALNFGESWTEWRFDHIVCWLYINSSRQLPALVRQWWSTADSRVSAAVDKITTLYVSPMLCEEELQNTKTVNIENMHIRVHPSAREVVALYQMTDTKLELSIVLPPNHPLGPVTVTPGQHAGGAANWRNCHMQLSIFLTHQNGSVCDGLTLWKRNLDKKFAGVEECYICFSIFHLNTYQIPKLSCHTCRKKFHTPCLYKWFNTSQNSTCPICRNVF